jgi:NRPS condensation-like uncharacterized protein
MKGWHVAVKFRSRTDMPGRLNIFQRTMLHWNDLHPYNAVHVVRIPAPLDLERLGNVVNGTLEAHGLTGLTLNRGSGTYRYHGGPVSCEIKTITGGESRHASLCAEIERQLNTAFVQGERFNPFKFFVAPERDCFSLGVVYFHAVADAESMVLLIKEMVETYLKGNGSQLSKPLNLYPNRLDGLLQHPKLFARKLAALPSLVRDMASSCRLHYRDEKDFNNRFTFFALDSGNLDSLIKTAKAWNVTLNDLFLSLLMKCFSHLESDRLRNPRRRKISVGCIVNLRKDLGLDDQRTFGLFLGSLVITHEIPDGISLMELTKDIRRRTLAIKQGRLYMGTSLEMAFGRFMLSWFSVERQKKIYQKNYPLWGGITNLNLNSLWEQPPGEKPTDYFRAVSTGAVTPLVLSVTTVGDMVNLGITYRSTVFSGLDIERIKGDFLEMLKRLKHCP